MPTQLLTQHVEDEIVAEVVGIVGRGIPCVGPLGIKAADIRRASRSRRLSAERREVQACAVLVSRITFEIAPKPRDRLRCLPPIAGNPAQEIPGVGGQRIDVRCFAQDHLGLVDGVEALRSD